MTFDQLLKLILPIYLAIYFCFAFLLKTWLVSKRIGKNPLVLPKDDTAYGLVGRYFKYTLIAILLYVVLYAVFPESCFADYSFKTMDVRSVQYAGLVLMAISFLWTIKAQNDMRNSWRIGIDTGVKTELIATGLFSISRNPIFLGMVVSLIGLFLATPNAFTLLFLMLGYVLIQVQIRLEEEHLSKMNGEVYKLYCKNVRRLV